MVLYFFGMDFVIVEWMFALVIVEIHGLKYVFNFPIIIEKFGRH